MMGKSLNEFIGDLYYNAEMEFTYKGQKYIITGYISDEDYAIEMFNTQNGDNIFSVSDPSRQFCVQAFENVEIFDGKTIYEAESEIEVLFG